MPIEAQEDETTTVAGVPARMRAAREAAGLSLKDIADTTRVPLRHLVALEEGNYGALPGVTYCAGFARAYARAVGLDEAALAADVRNEIGAMGGLGQDAYEFEEAVNPARVPPRWLAWTAAIAVLVIAGGYSLWRTQLTTPPTDEQIAAQTIDEASQATPAGNAAAPVPAVPVGPVVMTAADDVWLRIYQPDGTRLYEGTLKRGESYTVPDDAREPMILTGRPDALAVTVGGQAVSPLGTAERTIADVPVYAAALIARAAAAEGNGASGNAAAPVSGGAPRVAPATRVPTAAPLASDPGAATNIAAP
jgi:cytoskeleton protein RodZ